MGGTDEAVQSRVDDLQHYMRAAYTSLTRFRMTHRSVKVKDAAAAAQAVVVAACNDTGRSQSPSYGRGLSTDLQVG